jgi:hypothetical protein
VSGEPFGIRSPDDIPELINKWLIPDLNERLLLL